MERELKIKELLQLSRQGEIDIVAWNKYFIGNVLKKDAQINAWAYFDEDLWLKNLHYALENPTEGFTSLLGVPVGVKDIFNTIDMPTSMGSPIWKGFTPGNDARVVHNIKFNGGFVAGKTVTAEFAVHTPNETRNPWNLAHSPGTSSSGSAAAVAADMVPLALGTQTAGSIIRPASYCGVYGYKPTFGALPRTGMLKTTDTLDAVGLFARNIDDCEVLFDVMRVKGLDYPMINNFLENKGFQQKNSAKWKVGIVSDQHPVCKDYSAYASGAFQKLVDELGKNDQLELVHPQFPGLFSQVHDFQKVIYHKALSYYFKHEFQEKTLMSPVMYEIVTEGNKISTEQYQHALKQQVQIAGEIERIFDEVDVLITLSTAGHAPEFGVAIDPADTSLIWSVCGLPVVNVPCFSHNGLPFGLQVVGRKYTDYKVMDFVRFLNEEGIAETFSRLSPL